MINTFLAINTKSSQGKRTTTESTNHNRENYQDNTQVTSTRTDNYGMGRKQSSIHLIQNKILSPIMKVDETQIRVDKLPFATL